MTSVRVLLADDHQLVRAGIRALLEKLPGLQVVGEADDGRELLDLARNLQPDLILMDVGMPGLNGLEATARLTKEFPHLSVIMLSIYNNEEYVWQALKAGAMGYLLKKAATAQLAAAIQKVLAHEIYLSPGISISPQQVTPQQLEAQKTPLEQLSPRQREILQLIAEGRNTKEIAFVFSISTKTVEYHRMQIMERLRIYDIPGLVRFALRVGLIQPET